MKSTNYTFEDQVSSWNDVSRLIRRARNSKKQQNYEQASVQNLAAINGYKEMLEEERLHANRRDTAFTVEKGVKPSINLCDLTHTQYELHKHCNNYAKALESYWRSAKDAKAENVTDDKYKIKAPEVARLLNRINDSKFFVEHLKKLHHFAEITNDNNLIKAFIKQSLLALNEGNIITGETKDVFRDAIRFMDKHPRQLSQIAFATEKNGDETEGEEEDNNQDMLTKNVIRNIQATKYKWSGLGFPGNTTYNGIIKQITNLENTSKLAFIEVNQ